MKIKITSFLTCFILGYSSFSSKDVVASTYVFHLDISNISVPSPADGFNIGLRGNVSPLTWVKGLKLSPGKKSNEYLLTVNFQIQAPVDLYYKFVLDEVGWEGGDARKLTIEPNTAKHIDVTFDYVSRPGNPFKKFLGEWKLKDDVWESKDEWGASQLMKIPGHHTICRELNTDNSLLWIVNATSARGHCLWVYDHAQKKVSHSSSFMPFRSGIGEGEIDADGNVRLKVTFEGEPQGTYRIYTYTWINDDEYVLASKRYDHSNKPTGDYYGGTFERIKNP